MTRPRTTRSRVETPLVVYGVNAVLELLRSGEPVDRLCLGRGPREAELSAAAYARGVRVEAAARAPGASRPPGGGGGRGGWGAPAARPPHLRLHGLHPHGPGSRVAQRRGGDRDRPLRADRSPGQFITPFARARSLTAFWGEGKKLRFAH